MVDIDAEIEGFRRVLESLDDLEEDFGDDGAGWLVGTAVEYAIYLEFGTSDMDPKPFFRPVLAEVSTKGVRPFIAENSEYALGELDDIDSILAALALGIERRIKEIITRKSLIDTGTLRASIVAVPGGDANVLPDASEFSGFSSDSPAPATAGRALAEESIEVDQ